MDCYASLTTTYQFAFIKTGLDPEGAAYHPGRRARREERLSKGTAIKHMLFEYAAESYRASDGFSSVRGKNQWHNQQRSRWSLYRYDFQGPRLAR